MALFRVCSSRASPLTFSVVRRVNVPSYMYSASGATSTTCAPTFPSYSYNYSATRNMSVQSRKRHKKIIKLAKGFQGRSKNCYNVARNRVRKALQHAYKGRKLKKRDARSLWIQKVNAAAREHGLAYSQLIHGMDKNGIELNRKVLAEISMTEPFTFKSVCSTLQSLEHFDLNRSMTKCKVRDLYISKPTVEEWPSDEELKIRQERLENAEEVKDPGYEVRIANKMYME